jgi:hypothetical protein
MTVDADKLKAVREWPTPKNKHGPNSRRRSKLSSGLQKWRPPSKH